jgi:hypothetical protein
MLASVSLYGSRAQTEELFSETVRNKWFWGNALNPLDKRTSLTSKNGGYLINGRKSFCGNAGGPPEEKAKKPSLPAWLTQRQSARQVGLCATVG